MASFNLKVIVLNWNTNLLLGHSGDGPIGYFAVWFIDMHSMISLYINDSINVAVIPIHTCISGKKVQAWGCLCLNEMRLRTFVIKSTNSHQVINCIMDGSISMSVSRLHIQTEICHEILYSHPWFPQDESYSLWWYPDFSPSTTARLTFAVQTEISQQYLHGLP